MRHRPNWRAALLAAMCLFYGSAVTAQAGDTKEEAASHFQRGLDLFQDGALRAALVEFERAFLISPNYRVHYNIGQIKFQLEDWLGASQSYERYLTEGADNVPPSRRSEIERTLETLRQRVGRVAVLATRDGAEVMVDDHKVGVTPLVTAIVLNVGRHRVSARTEDGAVASEIIDVAGGDIVEVKLKLVAPKLKQSVIIVDKGSRVSTQRRVAIAGWAVGGASLAAAVVMGMQAQSRADDRSRELKKDQPDAGKVSSLADSGRALAISTDVLGGVALLGVASGTVLWFTDKTAKAKKGDKKTQKVALNWFVGPRMVGAQGSF